MSLAALTDEHQMAIYAAIAGVLLFALLRVPLVGALVRSGFMVAVLSMAVFVLLRQAMFDPFLARLTQPLGISQPQVVGAELRIPMAPDGHFWAEADLNGVPRRMLIDTGATVTALSQQTAQAAGVTTAAAPLPIAMLTANGVVAAQPASVDRLRLGGIEARNLQVVVSPALGPMDVLGMNFLSQLSSWRVEGGALILVPKRPPGDQPHLTVVVSRD